MMHIDLMDGHFVKKYGLSPEFIRRIRTHTDAILDVHMMVEQPSSVVDDLIDAGADVISFHAEATNGEAFRLIDTITDAGRKVGVALNPETSAASIRSYATRLFKVTVMTVAPGFAGGRFIPEMLDKIEELRVIRKETGAEYLIEIDGQANREHFGVMAGVEPDVLIVGTSGLFTLKDNLIDGWTEMLDQYDEAVAEYKATNAAKL